MCKKLTFLIGFVLVLSLAGAATGANLIIAEGLLADYDDSTPGKTTVTAIPEPATIALLGLTASMANADIIAYWPFDEGTGDAAKDIVGGAGAHRLGGGYVKERGDQKSQEHCHG